MHSGHKLQNVLIALGRSPSRRKFKLSVADRETVLALGFERLQRDTQQFVAQRLMPASPINDGKQTPFRGHPVFVAQHGTATCCRRCLEKWHHIPTGRTLSREEEQYIVNVIQRWLRGQARTTQQRFDLPASTA